MKDRTVSEVANLAMAAEVDRKWGLAADLWEEAAKLMTDATLRQKCYQQAKKARDTAAEAACIARTQGEQCDRTTENPGPLQGHTEGGTK